MPYQVVWPRMNVFNADGEPTVLQRGEMLPDGVDDVQLETLSVIGAVRMLDYAPENDVNEPVNTNEPETPDMLQKPSPDDSKATWVEYATDERNPSRMSRSEANAMSKPALMDRFSS